MDPISAIGVASSILTFVEFSSKLINGIYEVAGSADGTTEENVHIATVIQDLENVTDAIEVDFKGSSKHEKELVKLANKCAAMSRDLQKILKSIKVKHGNASWQTIKAAWKSVTRKDKIQSLEKRISMYRSELILRLQVLLVDQNSPVKAHLDRISKEGESLKNLTSKRLKETQETLEEVLTQLKAGSDSQLEQNDALAQIRDELKNLKDMSESAVQENSVLERLYFADLYSREDAVADPSEHTFHWILGQALDINSAAETTSIDGDTEKQNDAHVRGDDGHEENKAMEQISDTVGAKDITSDNPQTGLEKHDHDDISMPAINHLAVDEPHSETPNDRALGTSLPESGKIDDTQQFTDGSSQVATATSRPPSPQPASGAGLDNSISIHDSPERAEEESRRGQLSQDFLKFLREDNGTFFISGKAGSGKSTLMKFLGSPENAVVRDSLQLWASDRKLVFVSLFFWSAGSRLQRSLEGFYRSLLSQVLGQCPELAHYLLSTAIPSSPLGNHPFRLSELKQAISELSAMRYLPGYRICFLIDGVDEYEGDVMDHLYLARYLRAWSQHPNVKILCSGRPHAEFLDTFSQSGKTIQIQNFTRHDIYEFAFKTLQEENQLRPGPLKLSNTDLSDLSHVVVDLAEGVFLWACLVVRLLATKMGIYEKEKLLNLVAQTPRQLHKLYEEMLMKADQSGRRKGDKMLMLTLHNPLDKPLNAMTYSWLDELDDPTFPFSMEPYGISQTEIQTRLDTVRRELSDLTAGLLEMREYPQRFQRDLEKPKFLFYKYSVEPFHRTVKDFLVQDWFGGETHTAAMQPITREVYFKLTLAELKATVSMEYWNTSPEDLEPSPCFTHFYNRYIDEFSSLAGSSRGPRGTEKTTQVNDNLIEQFEQVIQAYQSLLDRNGQGHFPALPTAGHVSLGDDHHRLFSSTIGPSLVHLACHEEHPGYALRQVDICRHISEVDSADRSLLLTAFYESHVDVACKAIDKGASLNAQVNVRLYHPGEDAESGEKYRKTIQSVSLWLVMLRVLMLRICYLNAPFNYGGWGRPVDRMAAILAYALRHGDKVDTDIVVLLAIDADTRPTTPGSEISNGAIAADEAIPPPSRSNTGTSAREGIQTANESKNIHYIDLEQVIDLWVVGNDENDEEDGTADINFLRDHLVASMQGYWRSNLVKLWRGVPEWMSTRKNTSSSLAGEARRNYPRADVNQYRNDWILHGVVSSTESFVGDFWVALA
ncbi:hypothetical protein JX265_000537 [Neoarthrinium moseri]|uniref:NACHT domain-containing protein n=1 Tax=Neoarthrinium moseri TaxID=1658444 RepID=A0A9P9WYQ6_9PEZI|nr:hypothetical protein JX265_000537 [Neoarthrinium moseri]